MVEISGLVQQRKSPNLTQQTGLYEIQAQSLTILNPSKLPPFLIDEQTDGLEKIRLRYRYLDLRRYQMQQNLIKRSQISNLIRMFLNQCGFVEIETPILSKKTPEGARDYLVPTRDKRYFALPQSPQIYKQLLMLSGFKRYFQFARCFRDEDLRSDRQLEFMQLDLEMAFCNANMIQNIIEEMLKNLFMKFLNITLTTPFVKLSYQQARR